jgi:preprotein translocase subunit SecD
MTRDRGVIGKGVGKVWSLWRCLFKARAVALRAEPTALSHRFALPSLSQEEIERGAIACLIGVVVIAIMIGI